MYLFILTIIPGKETAISKNMFLISIVMHCSNLFLLAILSIFLAATSFHIYIISF